MDQVMDSKVVYKILQTLEQVYIAIAFLTIKWLLMPFLWNNTVICERFDNISAIACDGFSYRLFTGKVIFSFTYEYFLLLYFL